jgi:hypothetical protein
MKYAAPIVLFALLIHVGVAQAATPPYPLLPVVTVVDSNSDDVLDQDDIDDAMTSCGSGCNLYFPAGVYLDVRIEIESFPNGFAMYGNGRGNTILRGPVFTTVDRNDPYRERCTHGVVIQDLSVDGRKLDQDPALLYPTRRGLRLLHNGGCQTKVIDNVVSHSVATGGEAYNLGKGITCTGIGGADLFVRGNVSIGNQANGYSIACTGGNVTFENNNAANNCKSNATITGKDDPQGVIIGNSLADTYAHPSVAVTGYTTEVYFYSGSLNDADDVAYCPLESPVPAGCDP